MTERRSWLLAVPLALCLSLTACLSGKGIFAPDPEKARPTVITTHIMNYASDIVGEDNFLWKELERRTNTQLKITWIPSTSYDYRIKMLLASGDLPDLTFVINLKMPLLQELIRQGEFWDLTPYIDDYPHLAGLPEHSWKNSMIDGKKYAVPRYYPKVGGDLFPMLRKDWLDRLNLKVPETLDELYDVLHAFTYQDPDNNGLNDTIGFTGALGSFRFAFNTFNETDGHWKVKGDQIVPILTEPASREALLWIKRAYDDGIIDRNFPIIKLTQTEEAMKTGKAGVVAVSMAYSWKFIEALRSVHPKADVLPLSYLKGPTGQKYVPANEGFFGAYFIPKKVPEEKMKKILQFLDYGYSPEGNDLVNFGLKDVHYIEKDGMKIATEQARKDLIIVGDNLGSIWRPLGYTQVVSAIGIDPEVYKRNQRIVEEREQAISDNPGAGLYVESYIEHWPQIEQEVNDLRTQVILGRIPIQEYDAFIEQLKTREDYLTIVREMNEAYQQKIARNE